MRSKLTPLLLRHRQLLPLRRLVAGVRRSLVTRILRAVLGCTCALEPQELQVGSLTMDLHRRILRPCGAQVHLSPKEFDLLAFMMQNQGVPVPHAELLRSVWGTGYGTELDYVRTYVCTLRKKIENDTAKPDYILTVPWVGYRFRNPSDGDAGAKGIDVDAWEAAFS